jgi:hypothetical protein
VGGFVVWSVVRVSVIGLQPGLQVAGFGFGGFGIGFLLSKFRPIELLGEKVEKIVRL